MKKTDRNRVVSARMLFFGSQGFFQKIIIHDISLTDVCHVFANAHKSLGCIYIQTVTIVLVAGEPESVVSELPRCVVHLCQHPAGDPLSAAFLPEVEFRQKQTVFLELEADVANQGPILPDLPVAILFRFHLTLHCLAALKLFHHVVDLVRCQQAAEILMPDFRSQSSRFLQHRIVDAFHDFNHRRCSLPALSVQWLHYTPCAG